VKCLVPATGICCIFLAALGASASAVGTWKSLAPLPVATEGPSAARVGNVIVAAYGCCNDSKRTLLYDIKANKWSEGAEAPGLASSEGIGVADSKNVYALGGRNGAGKDNNRYTPATNAWTELAPMPTGRDGLGAAIIGRTIYTIGGRPETGGPCSSAEGLAIVEKYNIGTNKWSAAAPLPASRSDVGVIAVGGKVYAFGGCGIGGVTGEVDIYDPKTNVWTPGTPMPTPRAGFYGIGVKGKVIYVIGGLNAAKEASAANEAYDTVTNSWSSTTPMPHPRGEMGVVSMGSRIFTIGGGLPAFGSPQPTNDVFTP
jgi:kelch-like protein 1/4/5